MDRYGSAKWKRQRDARRNSYRECPKPGHGAYGRYARTLGGNWVEVGCPRCQAAANEGIARPWQ
jgi:hypothetical protein